MNIPSGFLILNNTPLEISYNKEKELVARYFLICKNGSKPIYLKVDNKGNPLEIYPLLIENSFDESLNEIEKPIPYEGMTFSRKPSFISYDLKNRPTEIYNPVEGSPIINKYNRDILESVYYDMSPMMMTLMFPEYVLKYDMMTEKIPDYVILCMKNRTFHAILFGYTMNNRFYQEIRNSYFNDMF